jgi:hypothetical protein
MNRKIIDIFPPKKLNNKEEIKTIRRTEIFSYKQNSFLSKKENQIYIFLFLILVGIFSYLYFVLPVAEIEIWPKTEELNLRTELKLEKNINEADFAAKIIPARALVVEEVVNQEFEATEKFLKESRAEGIIRLYNDYSTATQTLIARTRFISADRKQFRTPVQVVIPGRRQETGRWVPGTVDIKVIADQPGEEFNISPTFFSIPGFLGLARFHKIYARSYQPMTGGMIEEVMRVSTEDLKRAENTLEPVIKNKCLTSLRNKIIPGYDFLEEEIKIEILEKTADVEIGAEVKKFNFQKKASCQSLIIRTADIENFAKNFILTQLSENKIIVPESLKIDKSIRRENIDLNLIFNIYSMIDKSFLQKELIGKSLNEAQFFLEELSQINKVNLVLWPFWVRSVPEELERIKIELKFERVD